MINVKRVDDVNPPITACAIGALNSAPGPTPKARGSMAKIIERVVIIMGRSLIGPACRIASVRPIPRRRACLMKSISNMAFLVTNPIKNTIPIRDIRDMEDPKIKSPRIAPMGAIKSDIPMANGSRNDSNCEAKSK